MASSSSSSSSISHDEEKKYDVFLSFRGEDTRHQFASYLYDALHEKRILTFMDIKLDRGDEISPTLGKAIEDSVIAVVILSANYATSTWCLEELVHILDCKKRNGQTVIPIFYDIDPSVVRRQKGSYKAAFDELEERFKDNMEKVKQWRAALKEVADLSGLDSRSFRPENQLIEKIVEDVLLKLPKYPSWNMDQYQGRLFRIEEDIKQIESLLCLDSPDEVRVIGIWGMRGIGKTTLASLVFQKLSQSHFQGRSYLHNIRREYENNREDDLRKKLLMDLLKDEAIVRMDTPPLTSTDILDRLRRIKALIVLDDVDNSIQLEALAQGYQLARGSRIIVTTTNKQVLQNANGTHKVEGLNEIESLKLFSLHAFKKDFLATNYKTLSEMVKDYEPLSKRVTSYANGNPLAIKVLGSFLRSKSKEEWESALENLKRVPNKDILKVLRISYDGLDDEGIKNTFLDIAHFLYYPFEREFAELLLDGRSSSAKIGITVLIDKCLLEVFHENTRQFCMHDLIRQMGWSIEYEKQTRKRLHDANDVRQVLEKSTGTEMVELLMLDLSEIKRDVEVSSAAFSAMDNLRILRIFGDNIGNNKCRLHLPKGLDSCLFNELRYLQWDFCPLNTLPSNFTPENLVVLTLRHSNLKKLEKNVVQFLLNLRAMDLSHSKLLTQISDLSQCQNLESIKLKGCTSLFEILSSIQNLHKLSYLYLEGCTNLRDIEEVSRRTRYWGLLNKVCPWILRFFRSFVSGFVIHLPSFVSSFIINLSLDPIPAKLPRNIMVLGLGGTTIEVVPSSVWCLSKLTAFNLRGCVRLKTLPTSICKLKCLDLLDLSQCSNLKEFPEILKPMEVLSTLDLGGTGIRTLPESIKNLLGLTLLCLQDCKDLRFLPETLFNISSLSSLVLDGCSNLESLPPDGFSRVGHVTIRDCVGLKIAPGVRIPLFNMNAGEFLSAMETSEGWLDPLRFKTDKFDWIGAQGLNLADSDSILDPNTHDYVINHPAYLMLCCIRYRLTAFEKAPMYENIAVREKGDEIPKEFRYQNLGSSLNVMLPPNWNNDRLMGVAFCIVFHVRESPDPNLSASIAHEIDGVHKRFIDVPRGEMNSDRVVTVYSSKHVDGKNWISTRGNNVSQVSFRAWPLFYDPATSEVVDLGEEYGRIIKCGMWLVYMDDFEEYADGVDALFRKAMDSDSVREVEQVEVLSPPTGKMMNAWEFLSAVLKMTCSLYPLGLKRDKFDWIGAQGLNLADSDSNLDLMNAHDYVINHPAFLMLSCILYRLRDFQVQAPKKERIPFRHEGDEIPKEFRYQSLGASLNVELPPNWNNDRLMGVAFCIVFHVRQSPDPNLSAWIAFDIDDVRNKCVGLADSEMNSDRVVTVYSSKHLNGRNWISTRGNNVSQVSFRAWHFFRDSRTSEVVDLGSEYSRIIKCGMRLVYMDDLEEYADGAEAFFKERIGSHCPQEEEDHDDPSGRGGGRGGGEYDDVDDYATCV